MFNIYTANAEKGFFCFINCNIWYEILNSECFIPAHICAVQIQNQKISLWSPKY